MSCPHDFDLYATQMTSNSDPTFSHYIKSSCLLLCSGSTYVLTLCFPSMYTLHPLHLCYTWLLSPFASLLPPTLSCVLCPVYKTPVTSQNTHVAFADKLQLVLSHDAHHCHFLPCHSWDPKNFSSTLELGCYQAPTLSPLFLLSCHQSRYSGSWNLLFPDPVFLW